MLAAEQDPAEQELPKSICQPRHVRLFVLALNAGSLQRVENRRPFSCSTEIAHPSGVRAAGRRSFAISIEIAAAGRILPARYVDRDYPQVTAWRRLQGGLG
jgi:hypothetical protein